MNRGRNKKAFTLIELTIAIGVLSLMMMFSGKIFRMCIDGHQNATANADIMQRLRVITEQLNSDFSGICKDAPVLIKFWQDSVDPNIRDDQIMFFAAGDFQSIQLYNDDTGEFMPSRLTPPPTNPEYTIRGNTARVYYGLAGFPDPNATGQIGPGDMNAADRILARRRHILTAMLDTGGGGLYVFDNLDVWPDGQTADLEFDLSPPSPRDTYKKNELYEHDSMSLSQWKTIDIEYYKDTPTTAKILQTCFDDNNSGDRAEINMADPLTFHKLLCEHIGSFAVQWGYWDTVDSQKKLLWYPSDDPEGNNSDSHFDLAGSIDNEYGVYFNVPKAGISDPDGWHGINDNDIDGDIKGDVYYGSGGGESFLDTFFPKAFKFTFRIYDSKGFIKGGRLFTHIVYVD